MQFKLLFTDVAQSSLSNLKTSDLQKYKKVLKTLGLMETNLRHPSLNTHKYESIVISINFLMVNLY